MEYTPRRGRAVAFSMQVPAWKDDISSPDTKKRPRHQSPDDPLRALNSIQHDEDDGWIRHGRTKTFELYKLFEEWVYIYHISYFKYWFLHSSNLGK